MNLPMPSPETYLEACHFMPWSKTVEYTLSRIIRTIPRNGLVLDLMCGPAYLAKTIQQLRQDISIVGVDVNPAYIDYAKRLVPQAHFVAADVLSWQTDRLFDIVVCTAGLHHLSFEQQPHLIERMDAFTKTGGTVMLADSCIRPFATESDRRLAALELGSKYIAAVIKNRAPDAVVRSAIDILSRDLVLDGEYKTSAEKICEFFRKHANVSFERVWPMRAPATGFGDYFFYYRK